MSSTPLTFETLLKGRATPEGTAQFCSSFSSTLPLDFTPLKRFNPLGSTRLSVSRLGYGGYRLDQTDPAYAQSLWTALQHGCNLWDTASVYAGGESEFLMGQTLRRGINEGTCKREAIVLMTKIGYLQGTDLQQAKLQEQAGHTPYPDIYKYRENCWHCLHPEFLAYSLAQSRRRLGVECIDICLLHNPEYHFQTASSSDIYQKIKQAFLFLEERVQAGDIQYYGVSSNALSLRQREGILHAPTLLQIAEEVGGVHHHCRIFQFPFNMAETEALWVDPALGLNLGTYLEAAGVGVVGHRPLNTQIAGAVVRLNTYAPGGKTAAPLAPKTPQAFWDPLFQAAQTLLAEAPAHHAPIQQMLVALHQALCQFQGMPQWEQWMTYRWPALHTTLPPATTSQEWQIFHQHLATFLEEFHLYCLQLNEQATAPIQEGLRSLLPLQAQEAPLPTQVIGSLLNLPWLSSLLCGMRRPEYVTALEKIWQWPALSPERITHFLLSNKK